MKLGIIVGGLVALAIACGGSSKKAYESQPPPPGGPEHGGGMLPGDPRAEIDRLDGEITSDMSKLGEVRPEPAADACTQDCAQAMSGAAKAATADDATCKPASTGACGESCTLKQSICENAGRICDIAAKLGGADAYANDKCNRGSASCDAAKKRCCNCT